MKQKITSLCLTLLLLGALGVNAENLVKNGSFEKVKDNGQPESWIIGSNKADVEIKVVSNEKSDGENSLSIVNKTKRAPHVFARIQQDLNLEANRDYILTFSAKGEKARGIGFVIGQKWTKRYYPKLTSEWKEFTFKFKLQDNEVVNGKGIFFIITEDLADEFYIDNVVVKPAD